MFKLTFVLIVGSVSGAPRPMLGKPLAPVHFAKKAPSVHAKAFKSVHALATAFKLGQVTSLQDGASTPTSEDCDKCINAKNSEAEAAEAALAIEEQIANKTTAKEAKQAEIDALQGEMDAIDGEIADLNANKPNLDDAKTSAETDCAVFKDLLDGTEEGGESSTSTTTTTTIEATGPGACVAAGSECNPQQARQLKDNGAQHVGFFCREWNSGASPGSGKWNVNENWLQCDSYGRSNDYTMMNHWSKFVKTPNGKYSDPDASGNNPADYATEALCEARLADTSVERVMTGIDCS